MKAADDSIPAMVARMGFYWLIPPFADGPRCHCDAQGESETRTAEC